MAGYVGPTLRVGDIVSGPRHSLLLQSYSPREMQGGTVNADGYGAALCRSQPAPPRNQTVLRVWTQRDAAGDCRSPSQTARSRRKRLLALVSPCRDTTPSKARIVSRK